MDVAGSLDYEGLYHDSTLSASMLADPVGLPRPSDASDCSTQRHRDCGHDGDLSHLDHLFHLTLDKCALMDILRDRGYLADVQDHDACPQQRPGAQAVKTVLRRPIRC